MKKEIAIKEKTEKIVTEANIPGILQTIRAALNSKDAKCEVIGTAFVEADYKGLCLRYNSPLSGVVFMAIDSVDYLTKPKSKRGEEPEGYISMVIRPCSTCFVIMFNGKEYQI